MTRKDTIIAFSPFVHSEAIPDASAKSIRVAHFFLNNLAVNPTSPAVSVNFSGSFSFNPHKYLESQSVINTKSLPSIKETTTLSANTNLLAELKIETTDNTTKATEYQNVILTKYSNWNLLKNDKFQLPLSTQLSLTSRPESRLASSTQPIFISVPINFNETISSIKAIAEIAFDDSSTQTIPIAEFIYQDIAGTLNSDTPHVLELFTTLSDILSKIIYTQIPESVTITFVASGTDITDVQISHTHHYVIDEIYYPEEQIIIYKNPYGVFDVLRAVEKTELDLDRTTETLINNDIETVVKTEIRKKISVALSDTNSDQSIEICEEIAQSKQIYLYQHPLLIPIILSSTNLKHYDSSKHIEDIMLEFKYAQIR